MTLYSQRMTLKAPDDPVWSKPIDEFEAFIDAAINHMREYPLQWVLIGTFPTKEEAQSVADAHWGTGVGKGLSRYHRNVVYHDKKYLLYGKYKHGEDDDVSLDGVSDDIVKLCDVIAEGAERNGFKVQGRYTKQWLNNARLCFERASELGKDADSVINLAKWALSHHFWQQNIRSVPKFYKQYDRLREQANAESRGSDWSQRRANMEKFWSDDTPEESNSSDDIWGN